MAKAKLIWRQVQQGTFWKPTEVGEEISGVITNFRLEKTRYGDAPVCEIVLEETGELICLWTSQADLRCVNKIPVGSAIRIVYRGEGKLPGRRQMKNVYEVYTTGDVKLGDDWYLSKGYEYSTKTSRGRKSRKERKQ